MVSSLAEQLARGASLNANLLNEKSRRQAASESYLFSPKEATQHDLDSLHALGLNGFLQLCSIQPDFARFEQPLFSDSARNLDRTLQNAEQNSHLDATLNAFLYLLGPFLLNSPTGKVLEWLVRRFRIHEFNVPSIVSLFLPYHETPHFTKMVSILHIPDRSPLRFLQPYKLTTKTLHRALLMNDMVSHPEVARLVAEVLPAILKNHSLGVHRALIAFHAGVLLEYVSKLKTLDENTIVVLLPAAVDPLHSASAGDSPVKPALLHELILGSYLVLAAISQKTRLTTKALKSLLASVVACAERVSPKQLVRTFVSLCAPQDQLEKISGNIVKRILATPDIEVELVDAMGWIGAEKFLCPLVDSLIARTDDANAQKIVESLLTSADLLSPIARSSAYTILHRLTEEELSDGHDTTLRALLSQLHQRHPKALHEAAEALTQEDEDKREAIEELTISLSVPVSGVSAADAQTATLLIGSANADATVRESAVRDLIKRLSEDSVSESEVASVKTTLLLRVNDTSAAVLQALYANSPDKVAQAFLTDSSSPFVYLDALKVALHSSAAKPSRELIRAHLSFLLEHFLPMAASSSAPTVDEEGREEDSEENRERSCRVLMDILFPFLLYSKPRMKTAQAVWEVLEATEDRTAFELLGGCVDAVKWEQAKPGKSNKEKAGDKEGMDVELLTKINVAVAAKIADNILASNYFRANFDALLEKLQDENPHGRAMGYLVMRALLNRLSGEQRVDAGHRVLQAMRLETLEGMGDFMRGLNAVGNSLDDASIGSAVVVKPSSQNTLHRLQLAVLSVLPSFPRPPGASLVWITEYPADSTSEVTSTDDVRGARYTQLLRAVYRLSNSSASLPLLSTYLLRSLFINLGDDALAFLAGVWLTAQDEQESSTHIQYAALRHACAFLEAHVATQRALDFQTVLPAILVMFQSTDATVREAAAGCVAAIANLSAATEAEAVYAFDAIYGNDSTHLQYLDWSDFQRYVKAIIENIDHLVHDPEYLQAFNREHLTECKGESKKLVGYKQRVLCYLVSHVNGCPLLNVKAGLLKSVEAASNEAKVQVLQPTVEKLLAKDAVKLPHFQSLASSAAAAFDTSSAAELNDAEKPVWSLYERLLSTSLKNASWTRPRDVLLHRLQHGLYAKLTLDRKSQLCRMLLDIGAEDDSVGIACKKTLVNLLDDVSLIARFVVSLQPQAGPTQPAPKRPRVEKIALSANEGLSSLAALAEVIGSLKIASSLDLLSCLLETLHKVTSNVSPDAPDRRYVEQLLMSAIENVVEHLPPTATVTSAAIRVDTLVDILRTSENPQTFHQACLLMASLARVAPDAVLHNVMPIFTFMGSNVFHRDDTYSFRVVQKTIDSIVPVMVSSLKNTHTSGLELYQASREFLRVFTNAANHIPRHRRVNFFSHLVDTLGPADFLAPVTMLLVDRVSSRVVRQTHVDSAGSLFLPLALHEHYAADLQLSSLIVLAHEVQRLTQDDGSSSPFLEDAVADDEQTHAELAARRRAAALLVFSEHALQRLRTTTPGHTDTERNTSKELLVLLLAISTSQPDDASYAEVASAARSAMASTLGVMSAPDFVSGILTLLDSGAVHAQAGALAMLAERLPRVAEKTRRTLAGSVVKIVDKIRDILSTSQEASLSHSALQALTSVSETLAPGEENSVAATVPLLLKCLSEQALRGAASTTLLALSSKLGPRAIPYLKDIVKACVGGIRGAITVTVDESTFVTSATNVLRNLLSSIPTFWGEAEILSVVELYLDSSTASTADATEVSLLVKSTAKRTSPNVLLPALCSMWAKSLSTILQGQKGKLLAYIHVIKISVKAASRPAVLENLRELFKTFLSVFELCAESQDAQLESHAVAAFVQLVVKLNETAFRPIFRKMFDWAFAEGSSNPGNRKIVFCHAYSSLLEYFKALMVSYMSFAWQALSEQLRDCATKQTDGGVWLAILQTMSKSMSADEDRAFWRHDKLRQFVPLAVQQVPVATSMNVAEGRAVVQECLTSLLALIDDDTLAKSVNLDVLMHSRSEDSRVRLFSLACVEQLWRAHGDKLLGFVAETATFVAEAAEDENDSVVQEAHRLKNAVESIGGAIDVS